MKMDKRKRIPHWFWKIFSAFFLLVSALLILGPLFLLVTGSFFDSQELLEKLGPVFGSCEGNVKFWIFPEYPTLKPYVELLLDTPDFFVMFWNSVIQVVPALIGQVLISVPAAWSFARYSFKGKRRLFLIYVALMIMPFQVLMVSNYTVLRRLGLMNTHFSIILPNIFSTLPVFIMTKFFKSIPESLLEAARLDGAGEIKIFLAIGLPLGSPGILAVLTLNFLEYWNALEQPLAFLKDKVLFPLSLYLPDITEDKAVLALAASLVMLIPAMLVFLCGQDYLEQGIAASGIKE